MVAPAAAYFKSTIMEKRKGQLDRMWAAQMFDPLYTEGTPATHASLVALKLYMMSEQPRLRKYLELAAPEMHEYNMYCQQIPAEANRNKIKKNGVTVDSFDNDQSMVVVASLVSSESVPVAACCPPAFSQLLPSRAPVQHS